ncbi:MAG: hypothetical protein JWM19_1653 [Actinomycetia bacterium]|nr:hypothetical protein [Actinomycetes bacterium]
MTTPVYEAGTDQMMQDDDPVAEYGQMGEEVTATRLKDLPAEA